MPQSAHTSGRSTSCGIGALVCLYLSLLPLRAQSDLPRLGAWHLLPDHLNAAQLPATTSATVLYGTAGKDVTHYLIQGSFPLDLGALPLALGATFEQGKSLLWQANDLTVRAGLPLLQRPHWQLTGGVEVNLLRRSFDGARALSEGITDSTLPTARTEGKGWDFGLGLHLASEHFEVGLSAQHLLGVELNLGQQFTTTIPRQLHAYSSALLGRRSGWALRPGVRLSYLSDEGARWELALGLHYRDRYQLRASWERQRWAATGAVSLGKFLLGYCWEQAPRGEHPRHEFLLSYRLPQRSTTPRISRYTSIRLL